MRDVLDRVREEIRDPGVTVRLPFDELRIEERHVAAEHWVIGQIDDAKDSRRNPRSRYSRRCATTVSSVPVSGCTIVPMHR